MNARRVCLLAAIAAPLLSSAAWIYDSDAGTLTADDGTGWTLSVTASGWNLTITGVSEYGSGAIDLTSCEANTGYKVTATSGFTAHKNPFYNKTSLKEFIAPDMTTVGAYFFESATAVTNIRLNASFHPSSAGVFLNCYKLASLYPTTFTGAAGPGQGAFQNVGRDVGAATLDLVFAAATSFGTQGIFSGAKAVRSVSAPNVATIGNRYMFQDSGVEWVYLPKYKSNHATVSFDMFKNCKSLTNFTFSASLAQFGTPAESAGMFYGCTALGEVTIGNAGMTILPGNTFYGCTSLSNVVVRSPIATVYGGALANIAPCAKLFFTGDAPTFEAGAICASDGEANDTRAVIEVVNGFSNPTWTAAVAANAATFEAYKSKPDYPGDVAFGLLASTVDGNVEYSWVVNRLPDFKISSLGGASVVSPACGDLFYGIDLEDGQSVSLAVDEAVQTIGAVTYKFTGWKIYAVADDGTETLEDAGDTLSCSYTWHIGHRHRFEWQAVAESAQRWVYDAEAGTLSDGWNWTLTVTTNGLAPGELAVSDCTAGSGDLDFTGVYADCGMKVVKLVNWPVVGHAGAFTSHGLTSFVAPDLIYLGRQGLCACMSLTNIVLSSAIGTIGDRALRETRQVRSFSPQILTNLTAMGQTAFNLCGGGNGGISIDFDLPALASIPDSAFMGAGIVRSLTATGVVAISNNGFSQSGRIVFANLPRAKTIGNQAFYLCQSLTNVVLASGEVEAMGTNVFWGCTAFVGPVVMSSPTLANLPSGTFCGCSSLSNVLFAVRMNQIGDLAFAGIAPGATLLFCVEGAPTFGADALYSSSDAKRARIYAHRGLAVRSGWPELAAPNAAQYAADVISRSDAPTADSAANVRPFGLLSSGGRYVWLVSTGMAPGLSVVVR